MMQYTPIGKISSPNRFHSCTPRQSTRPCKGTYIQLFPSVNPKQALEGLELFDHIIVITHLHKIMGWKPKVTPPGINRKLGVFATRSPHRPNPIGISIVQLKKIEGNILSIEGSDLFDQTPVLDIKPYIPEVDAFSNASSGWLTQREPLTHIDVIWDQKSRNWIEENAEKLGFSCEDIEQYLIEYRSQRKPNARIIVRGDTIIVALRTFRFAIVQNKDSITIQKIYSGYSKEELEDPSDKWGDKGLHRALIQHLETS